MAKDFLKSTGAKALNAVAKKSNETANVSFIIMVNDSDLVDFAENEEMGFSLATTEDLEIAIQQNGFTDPLEVIRLPDGKYEIISGHRRRLAGRNIGMTSFPVIVRENQGEVKNRRAVLEANFHRKMTPMQYARLIVAWEEQLNKEQMKGDKRKYISKVLNLSEAQISRYNSLNKMIDPLQKLVEDGKVGLSSISGVAKYSPEEQEEILVIFNQFLDSNSDVPEEDKYELLTRDKAKELLCAYEDGIKSYEDIQQIKGQMNIDDEEYNEIHPGNALSDLYQTPDSNSQSISTPTVEIGDDYHIASWKDIIKSLVFEMISYQFSIEDINGDCCSVLDKDYYAYNINNDGYITIEDEDEEVVFKISIERFKNEYKYYKAQLEKVDDSSSIDTGEVQEIDLFEPENKGVSDINKKLNETTEVNNNISEDEYDFDKISSYELYEVEGCIRDLKNEIEHYKEIMLDAPLVKLTKMKLDAFKLLKEHM